MMKKGTIVLIALGAILLQFVLITNPMLFLVFTPNPPEPQVKHAEFPFRLEYKLNGEKKVIQDTIICDFDGVDIPGSDGKKNIYKMCFKSGAEGIVLLNFEVKEGAIKELRYPVQHAGYYLGNENPSDPFPVCLVYGKSKDEDKYWHKGSLYSEKYLKKKYGIEIIKWECAPPVHNTFK